MPPKKRKRIEPASDMNSKAVDKGNKESPSIQQSGRGKRKRKTVVGDNKAATNKPVYTHWLIKSEPESRFENGIDMKFSFDDLKNCPNQREHWDGVRNYQARNFLRDEMKAGHEAFFYHSNCKEPGIAGLCKIVKSGYPDHTQFDKANPHYDSSSQVDDPKWFMVDVQYKAPLDRFVPLSELKSLHQEHVEKGGPLKNMSLFTRSRLSVQPVTKEERDFILQLSKTDPCPRHSSDAT